MFVIDTNVVIIYPVAFNLYIDKLDNFKENINKEQQGEFNTNTLLINETRLDEADVRKIQYDIDQCNSEKIVVIDFQNILIKDNRNFNIFLSDRKKRIIFANLSLETGFFSKTVTDLKAPINLQDRERGIVYFNEEVQQYIKQNGGTLNLPKYYCEYIASLINECLDDNNKLSEKEQSQSTTNSIESCLDDNKNAFEFLESSCVFSRKYVNIKKIFKQPDQGRFLMYCLAHRVKELVGTVGNYKLICTSKTGAIIANIISRMLNVPVVFCVGVGPKFAVKPDEIIEKVQKKESYVYIFDFICIGTELKILSTFISDRKSKLICGVGPASFIRCNHPEIVKRKLILNKMHPLINVQDYPYMGYEIKIP